MSCHIPRVLCLCRPALAYLAVQEMLKSVGQNGCLIAHRNTVKYISRQNLTNLFLPLSVVPTTCRLNTGYGNMGSFVQTLLII